MSSTLRALLITPYPQPLHTFTRYTVFMQTILRSEFEHHPLLARLNELHDIPEQLYIEGTLPNITLDEYGRATPRILVIVGSRRNTTYGEDVINHLVASLRNQPVIIISGLAYGIDSLAHKAALTNTIQTTAILGTGLNRDVMYPSNHLSLRNDIVEQGGAIISELEPHVRAAKWTFPARNRIVAALGDAILLVETGEQSGTLITARMGLELGRDIGAVPGAIFSEMSVGTNNLIKDGAAVITSPEDLFELLHLPYTKEKELVHKELTEHEQCIMNILTEPKERDLLLLESKLSLSDFLTTLSSLEIKGYVSETFGEVRKVV